MIFFTADTHFNHRNIFDYCKRGFKSCEELNKFIIKNWNERVEKSDTVYHLGDFGLGSLKELSQIRNQLNGRIILIEGNHDACISKDKWIDIIKIDEYVTELEFPKFYLRHHPPPSPRHKICLCGHVHNHWERNESLKSINVGIDVRSLKPVSYPEILYLLKFH